MQVRGKNMSYCFHCMERLKGNDTVCPHCGREKNIGRGNARALPPGTLLDNKYLTGDVVGEGGFGITYIGLDLNLHLKVAVKEYFPASFASRDTSAGEDNNIHVINGEAGNYYRKGLEDYASEANRLAKFASLPGIVSVLNFFYENNTAYMIMDFVEGITLKEYLRKNNEKLPWRKTLELLHPVILSLMEVHKEGIIHRDISPDNIMISKSGGMVLIDFGAARKVDDNQKKTVILKKGYAPMEQYQTDGNQGSWSDVYSFCATIYRIIGGVKAPDALAVASGSVRITPLKELVKDIPDYLDRAVRQGMENDISDRIHSMEELEGYLYRGKRVKNKAGRKKVKAAVCIAAVIFLSVTAMGAALRQQWAKRDALEGAAALTDNNRGQADGNAAEEDRNRAEKERENSLDSAGQGKQGAGQTEAENEIEEKADSIDAEYEALADTQGLTYENTEDGLAVTGVDYSVTEVVIPGEINGQPVKELRSMSPNATSVVIKNGTERIMAGAFKNCVYLESVYIPASVTKIDDSAFENCLLLNNIIVSANNSEFYSEDGKLYRKDGR